jgi:hypothetical protein
VDIWSIGVLPARQARRMGIRYYAYAFDADMTTRALADPASFISDDPLAEDLVELQHALRDDVADDCDAGYAIDFLKRAVEFVTGLAASHRGFVYMIG